MAAEDGIEGQLEAGDDGEQAQGTGRRSKSGRAEAQEKLPYSSDTERSAGGVTASASVEDDPALRVISGGHGIDKERDLTIEGAKDILKAQGGYSDDVVDKTIALLDPQQSGMIKMEDFRKAFQAKMSAPKLSPVASPARLRRLLKPPPRQPRPPRRRRSSRPQGRKVVL